MFTTTHPTNRKGWIAGAAFCLLALLPACGNSASGSAQDYESTRHAGTWWQTLSADQKDGFVSGYADCYTYDLLKSDPPGGSRMQWVELITKYYQAGNDKMSVPAGEVLVNVGRTLPRQPDDEPQPHGYFDGEFWRQISEPERVEFVRGYLQCRDSAKPAKETRPPDFYASAISNWYRIDPKDVAEIDPARKSRKIADVLLEARQ